MWLLILFVGISFVPTNALPLGGLIGTDSVEATGQVVCASLPVTNATVKLTSSDAKGNRALVTEDGPDERGFFRIQGTEKEVAMPEFWLEILHYCSDTRPVEEKKYERRIEPRYYYDSHSNRSHLVYATQRIDLLIDS